MSEIIAVCPGSFDPMTMGHLDIIRHASRMFESVVVLVMTNVNKTPTFTSQERVELIRRVIGDLGLDNVRVDSYDGLLADYIHKIGAAAIVKGLRAVSDFEYEFQMALTNKKLCPDAETMFFTADAENMYLSSSVVKQVGSMGGDIRDFVPAQIYDDIIARLHGKGDK